MYKKNSHLLIAIALFVFVNMYGQKEASRWYFGHYAGLNFNTDPPTAIEDGNDMATFEGCTAISDSSGNLLFSSDGIRVWDKNHNLMKNASGTDVDYLSGNPSATQSGLVVPDPGNANRYYLFSLPAFGSDTGYYSIVDFSSNPLGIVTNINTNLYTDASIRITERITATVADNEQDIWIVTHEHGTGNHNFVIHKITRSGISFVKKQAIDIGTTRSALGAIKFSPKGTKLAMATYSGDRLAILDFDKSAGNLSLREAFDLDNPFGVEFSPNSELLYVSHGSGTGGGNVLQYDVTASSILGSQVTIYTYPDLLTDSVNMPSCMQIGIDGKVYVTKNASKYIAIIKKPNVKGTGCDYTHDGIDLNPSGARETPASSRGYTRTFGGGWRDGWGNEPTGAKRHGHLGLPNFIQSFFSADIRVQKTCLSDATEFTLNSNLSDYEIDYGDGSAKQSGVMPAAKRIRLTHTYARVGDYNVVIVFSNRTGKRHTVRKDVSITDVVISNFDDQSICINSGVLVLGARPTGGDYTGSAAVIGGNRFSPTTAGVGNHNITYTYRDKTCTKTKTINVRVTDVPKAGTDGRLSFCEGVVPTLAQLQNAITGEDAGGTWTPALAAGITSYTYTVNGAAGCSSQTDTSVVTVAYTAKPKAGTDGRINLCEGAVPTIAQLQSAITGEDAGGTWTPTPAVGVTTYTYTVAARSPCTIDDVATVTVNYEVFPNIDVKKEEVLCPKTGKVTLAVTNPSSDYLYEWTDASGTVIGSNATVEVRRVGAYNVKVTNNASSLKCEKSFALTVKAADPIPLVTKEHLSFAFIKNGEQMSITMKDALKYYQFAIDKAAGPFTDKKIFNLSYGLHTLYIRDKKGCFKDHSIEVFVIKTTNFFTPNNDGTGDLWDIEGLNMNYFKNFRLTITDRYGRIIKTYINKFDGWDGKDNNGKLMPSDDYWYKLNTVQSDGSTIIRKGHFSLVQ